VCLETTLSVVVSGRSTRRCCGSYD